MTMTCQKHTPACKATVLLVSARVLGRLPAGVVKEAVDLERSFTSGICVFVIRKHSQCSVICPTPRHGRTRW